MTGPPWPAPATLSQAEAGPATATASETEQRHKAEAKENLEVGAAVAVFALVVLLGWLCLPKEAMHPGNARFTVSLLLSFATFLSGNALMLLSFNMLGLREDLVSGGQRVAAKCLLAACAVMSVLTLLSLLALLPGRVYLYIGLAVVTAIMLTAAGAHCYLRLRAGGGGKVAADAEGRKKLDAASSITSCVTYSAFGGVVGVLFNASKISGAAADAVDRAAQTAIFFMFSTAIVGISVMTVSKKVAEISNPRCRQFFVTAIRLANAFLLCSLACAGFAAAFVVLQYRIFLAFAPLVITAIICFLLRHCVARRGHADWANMREKQEAKLKALEDIASKVTAATLGAIMSILGGALGQKDHEKWGAMDMFMVVLTSAFASGFGFMMLAAAPGSARARLAPVARVLVWSTMALFVATAVAIYGVEVWTM